MLHIHTCVRDVQLLSERLRVKWLLLFAFFFLLDRLTKYIAITFFSGINDRVVRGVVSFVVVHNEGIAFGMKGVPSFVIVGVGFAVIVFLVVGFDRGLWFEYIMLLSGVAGNLFDRLFYGYVVDFIYVEWWYTFNVADILIVVGGLMAVLKKIKPRRLRDSV